MKKLLMILIAGLMTGVVCHGFPYHTNSVTLNPGSLSEDYGNFNWTFSGYDDEVFNVRWAGKCSNAVIRFSYPKSGAVYLQWTNITVGAGLTNFVTTIVRTNLTLSVNTYYVEILGYQNPDYTMTPTRMLGKGKANMHWSIFNNSTFVTNRYSPAGDITAVLAGTNLLGGGTSGSVTLNVNMANVGSSGNVTAVSNIAVTAKNSAIGANATGAVHTAGITALNTATNLLESDVNLLKTRVDAAASTNASQKVSIDALNTATNLLEGDANLLKTRVDAAASTNASQAVSITALNTASNLHEAQINALQTTQGTHVATSLAGGAHGGEADTLQSVVTRGGTVTTGIVTIDSGNARTNRFGGKLVILGGRIQGGQSCTASGTAGATALGEGTLASGSSGATALGESTVASGLLGATALGYGTTAIGTNGATALGMYARAIHDSAFAWSGQASGGSEYDSKGYGTFCLDPVGGFGGMYVGATTLTSWQAGSTNSTWQMWRNRTNVCTSRQDFRGSTGLFSMGSSNLVFFTGLYKGSNALMWTVGNPPQAKTNVIVSAK